MNRVFNSDLWKANLGANASLKNCKIIASTRFQKNGKKTDEKCPPFFPNKIYMCDLITDMVNPDQGRLDYKLSNGFLDLHSQMNMWKFLVVR